MLKSRIIKISGQNLITGLLWQNIIGPGRQSKSIVAIGKEVGRDVVCVSRIKNPTQVGYAKSDELLGFTNVRSLAGGLAEMHTGSWLGIFQLPDEANLYYYIAVNNDHILSDSDIVGEINYIRSLFESTLACGGWQFINVPSDMVYPNVTTTHLTLAEMLVKKAPKLKQLEFKVSARQFFYALGVMAILGVPFVGYSLWQQSQEQLRQEELQRISAENDRLKTLALEKEKALPPWQTAVPINNFLDACNSQWLKVRYSLGGWQLTGWICEANQTIASYDKTATASSIQLIHDIPDASLSADGRKAVVITPIRMDVTGALPAVTGNTSKLMMNDYIERHALSITFQPAASILSTLGAKILPTPSWSFSKLRIDSLYAIFDLVDLALIPGFVAKNVSLDTSGVNWKWRLEAELYVIN